MQGLKQTLLNTAARLSGKKVEERPLFKALDDVSFSIEQGKVVGIIGHNTSGKRTMLKLLSDTQSRCPAQSSSRWRRTPQ